MLKLFFAESTGAKTALEHIESFETKIQGELQYLQKTVKTLEAVSDNDSSHFYYLLTARFGVKAYRAYLEWCSEVKTDLNGHLR